jgi:hypothetical protein
MIQESVISEYYEEIERAKQPGYVSRYDDFEFEYSDAPRVRPARFDQPHNPVAEAPHMDARFSRDAAEPKPHFHVPPPGADREDARPAGNSFGAGIFPE